MYGNSVKPSRLNAILMEWDNNHGLSKALSQAPLK
jgi:hypothetical protein